MALLYGAAKGPPAMLAKARRSPSARSRSRRGTILTRIFRSGIVPRAIFVAIVGLNIGLTLHIALGFQIDRTWPDWELFVTAGERLEAGLDPYAFGTGEHMFRWSPLLAYVAAVVSPLGPWLWSLVAIASLALLRDWRLAAVFLLAYPFWIDLAAGASFWFLPLVGILGPLWFAMLPVAVWLTAKGHVGLASMAAAPYWLPSYYLMLLLEPIVVSGRIWSVLGGGASADASIDSGSGVRAEGATSLVSGDERAARQSGGP